MGQESALDAFFTAFEEISPKLRWRLEKNPTCDDLMLRTTSGCCPIRAVLSYKPEMIIDFMIYGMVMAASDHYVLATGSKYLHYPHINEIRERLKRIVKLDDKNQVNSTG